MLGARRCILSDKAELLPALKANAAANGFAATVECTALDWADTLAEETMADGASVVLMSDCLNPVYGLDHADDLGSSLAEEHVVAGLDELPLAVVELEHDLRRVARLQARRVVGRRGVLASLIPLSRARPLSGAASGTAAGSPGSFIGMSGWLFPPLLAARGGGDAAQRVAGG